jgi:hypothetical protein
MVGESISVLCSVTDAIRTSRKEAVELGEGIQLTRDVSLNVKAFHLVRHYMDAVSKTQGWEEIAGSLEGRP